MNDVAQKVDKVKLKDTDATKDNKEHRPTLRNKSVKKKKLTDEEILAALRTSFTSLLHLPFFAHIWYSKNVGFLST